ncbi:RNA-protein complex protein Nop10 [Methanosarcina barkeri]|uniref:RNA-protein complex protein Nop10 n=1 Tax=Methanosarcina barkeri TaxID=2208 RepID=UPI0009BAB6B8|nr:RNA-protein complex protein Nop10 [Methanosarcina barkeri]
MGQKIRKCKNCGRYTLREICPVCGEKAFSPNPARFSPQDPYGRYRRMAKERIRNCYATKYTCPPERKP